MDLMRSDQCNIENKRSLIVLVPKIWYAWDAILAYASYRTYVRLGVEDEDEAEDATADLLPCLESDLVALTIRFRSQC